ncbi:hypothetical protein DICA0_F09494 [Diutina catenulata]
MKEQKPKTPLKKEELEAIAKELKKKLSKASITAKSLSPTVKKSPLKSHLMRRSSPASSPMFSPHKSPTHHKPSSVYLSSSPLKAELESPTKRMVLEHASPTCKLKPSLDDKPLAQVRSPLRPSPMGASRGSFGSIDGAMVPSVQVSGSNPTTAASSQAASASATRKPSITTPKQQRRELVKTPQRGSGGPYDEGADLLMYLATSPSPSKPQNQLGGASGHLPTFGAPQGPQATGTTPKIKQTNTFVAPAPPMTPKRPHGVGGVTKTPQNRLTPGLFNNLPSQGLTLTPTGFNMNDYVNFFTPSPGGDVLSKNLLKTPDFNNLLNQEKKF